MATTEAQAAQAYTQVKIGTASKRQAIYLLHEKAIYLLQRALYFPDARREYCNRVQNILSQLQCSLMVNDALSESLYSLYDYCYLRLERGDVTDVVDSGKILRPLRHTFFALLSMP